MGKHVAPVLEVFPIQVIVTERHGSETHGIYNLAQWEEFISYELGTWPKRCAERTVAMQTIGYLVDAANKCFGHGRPGKRTALGMHDTYGNEIKYELSAMTGTN